MTDEKWRQGILAAIEREPVPVDAEQGTLWNEPDDECVDGVWRVVE